MADVLAEIRNLMAIGGLPELGPGPRENVLTLATLEDQLNPALTLSHLPRTQQKLIHALVLLWHDHQDAAHTIAQEIETPDGSLVHGILHRREPDYGNAAYWFRRVGKHPTFPILAEEAAELLSANDQQSLKQN